MEKEINVLESFAFDSVKAKEEQIKRQVMEKLESDNERTFNPRTYIRLTKADYLKKMGIGDEDIRTITWTAKALEQYNEQ